MIFGCVFIAQGNKRVVERAAAAVTAVYALIAAYNRLSSNVPLPCPRTVKVEYFPFGTAVKIHRRAHCGIKEQFLSSVYNLYTAGNRIQILKYRIRKEYIYILIGIFKTDNKRLNLISCLTVGRRKTL